MPEMDSQRLDVVRMPRLPALLWSLTLLRFAWQPLALAVAGRWVISYLAIVTSALVAFAAAQAGRAPDGPAVLPSWLQLPATPAVIPRAMAIAAGIVVVGAVLEVFVAWCASWMHARLNGHFTHASIDSTLETSSHADAVLNPSTAVQRWLLKVQITDLFHNGVANVLGGLGTLVIVLVATFRLNVAAGWVCVAAVVLWIVAAVIAGRRAVRASRDAACEHESVGAIIRATVALRQDLWRPSFHRFWQQRSDPAVARLDRAIVVQGFWGSLLYGGLTGLANVAPLIAVLVAFPSGGVGTAVASYLFVSRLMPPLTTLATMMPLLQEYLVSVQRVHDAFARHIGKDTIQGDPAPVRGEVLHIASVRVPLEGDAAVAVDDVALRRGHITFITGPSGSGKSTLLRALCGMEDHAEVALKVDGVRMDSRSPSWAEACLLLPQEPALLPGSAGDNLFAFPHWTTADELSKLLDAVESSLPGGLATPVGVDATGVSVGQRRALALLRALGSPSTLLLLDEPLAGLDGRLAALVSDALTWAAESRWIIVAAHEHDLERLRFSNAECVRLPERNAVRPET